MTIQAEGPPTLYRGDGATLAFPTVFEFLVEDHLAVYIHNETSDATSLKVLTDDYAVTGGSGAAGTVTFVIGSRPEQDEIVVLLRVVPFTQLTDYVENDAFNATLHEDGLDKLTMLAQQLKEEINRISKVPVWSNATPPAVADVRRVERIFPAMLSSTADSSATYSWDESDTPAGGQVTPDIGAVGWTVLPGGSGSDDHGRAREFEGCTSATVGAVVVMMLIEDSAGNISPRFFNPGACV